MSRRRPAYRSDMHGFADRGLLRVEVDVAEEFQGARGQVAAGRIENGVMIREGHVLQPMLRHFLIEGRPASVAALKTELPREGAPKHFAQRARLSGLAPNATPSAPSPCRPCRGNKRCCIRRPSRSARDLDHSRPNPRAAAPLFPTTTGRRFAAPDALPASPIPPAR